MDIKQQASDLIKQANQFYGQKQYEQAIAAYREAIALAPDSPMYAPYKFVIGEMLMALERYPEAVQVYQEVVARTPEHDQAWCDLGQCLMLTNQYPEAIQAFERCLEIAPETGQALYYSAMVYAKLGQAEQARHSLQQAIKLQPDWKKHAQREALLKGYLPEDKAWWQFWK